ncbi:MAG: STAUR_1299 family protein [Myxococcota bacterium]
MRQMQDWLDLAFDSTNALHATAAIGHHRAQRAEELRAEVRSYEVVVKPEESLPDVAERVAPKFAYHMEALGLPRNGGPRMFFSVFLGDRLHFITAEDTMRLFDELIAENRVARSLLLPGR